MPKTQTRIKVGSGGLIYVGVTTAILTSAIYTQANLLFWGFGLLVGALVVSIGLAALALRGIEISRLVATHGAAGETLLLSYEVRNRSWCPAFAVVIKEAGPSKRGKRKTENKDVLGNPPHAWVLHVGPGRTVRAQAPCRPARRGRLSFERIEASTSFPFSIIQKTVSVHAQDETLIFPRLYRVRRGYLNMISVVDGDGRFHHAQPGGIDEFFGVREYRPGDSPRMIDWKRTARTGELAVREMTQPRPPSLSLMLDLGGQSPIGSSTEERAISLAASIVCEAYLHGFRVGLRVSGPDCPPFEPRHSLLHRTQILEALSAIDLEAPRPETAAADYTKKIDIVIRPGEHEDRLSGVRGITRKPAVLGVTDLDRYVTGATMLSELDKQKPNRAAASEGISQTQNNEIVAQGANA